MPTIVSGLDPSVRMNAYLQGQKFQTDLQQQQMEQEKMRRQGQQDFLKTMMDFRKQQAKSLEDVNARAQMGDVQALIQQDMEAQAANLPPEEKMKMEYVQLRPKVADNPKALAALDEAFGDLGKRIQTKKQRDAAMKLIEQGVKDGLIDKEVAQQRMDAGEEPETIGIEVKKARDQQREAAVNVEENALYISQGEEILKSLPAGSAMRRRGMEVLTGYKLSQSIQEKSESGKDMINMLRKAALAGETEDEQIKGRREKFRKDVEGQEPGMLTGVGEAAGAVLGMSKPSAGKGAAQRSLVGKKTSKSAQQTDATQQAKASPKAPADRASFVREAAILARQSPDKRTVALELKKRGYDLNDPNVQADLLDAFEAAFSAAQPRSIQ